MSDDAIVALEARTELAEEMIRAVVLKGTTPQSSADEDEVDDFAGLEIIPIPYKPATLIAVFENSSNLYPNVAAMMVNVDSYGHEFIAVLDPEADSAHSKVSTAIFLETALQGKGKKGRKRPTPEVVDERLDELRDDLKIQTFQAEAFFETCCVDKSFMSLRRRTRVDMEVTGNGYWEVIRDQVGDVSQFVHVPPKSVRMTRVGKDVEVDTPIRTSPLVWKTSKRMRRFRRYIQKVRGGAETRWFREFGDPRVMSPKTGTYYESEEELRAADSEDDTLENANEILHFKIEFPGTSYGVPRWIPALLSVLGTRQSEEVNFSYFDNKTVPPMAILVSGGRLSESAKTTIQNYLANEIRGRQNFHKILVIEGVPSDAQGANPGSADGNMRIEIKDLTAAQTNDGLFMKYDERNADKVGMAFRLPRLARGDVRDFNRATALTAMDVADTQVYGPERDDFDGTMNRQVMPSLGLHLVRFKSKGVQVRDQAALAEIMERLSRAGGLVPADIRRLSQSVLGVDLPDIDERWTRRPVLLTQGGQVIAPLTAEDEFNEEEFVQDVPPVPGGPPAPAVKPELKPKEGDDAPVDKRSRYRARLSDVLVAKGLVKLHEQMMSRESAAAHEEHVSKGLEPDVEIKLSSEDFDMWIESLQEAEKGE